jgi:hypothetical protein
MPTVTKTRLQRLPKGPYDDTDSPRYFHPNGYVIVRCKRSWSEQVGAMRGAGLAGPMYWWEIHRHVGRQDRVYGLGSDPKYLLGGFFRREETDCPTLREAHEWCDVRPRKGWNGQ